MMTAFAVQMPAGQGIWIAEDHAYARWLAQIVADTTAKPIEYREVLFDYGEQGSMLLWAKLAFPQ